MTRAALIGSLSLLAQLTGAQQNDVTPQANGITRTQQNVQIPQTPVDTQIATRIRRILDVTGWYKGVQVSSREGVVTLRGRVAKPEQREWAEDLSRDTEGVVAVLNDLQVDRPAWFDLNPAREETESLARRVMAFIPYAVTAVIILVIFGFLAMLNGRVGRRMARRKIRNPLLIEIVSKLFSLPVLVLGVYLVLRVFGLTGIAVTVLGGTGAAGLVAGLALRGILENYFAGVLLSLRNPYTVGDVVRVGDQLGIVRELTTRGTILVDFDGNHIIIPNSTIYQNVIVNLSANPSARQRFQVGIGYNDDIGEAREIILDLLQRTQGVLKDPEYMVVVEDFAPGSVILGVYFWIEPKKTNGMKLKSQVMENCRNELVANGFTLPRDVRLIAFPSGIPIPAEPKPKAPVQAQASTQTEIGSDTEKLLHEAERGRPIDHGDRLL